jgi:NADH dehydrogenase
MKKLLHTVFITGGTGFVGRHIIKLALEQGHNVTALVRSEEKAKRVLGINRKLKFVKGDITEKGSLERGMKGCDTVIHLVGIIYENRKMVSTFEAVHIQGTLNVLEAIKKAGIKRLLHMSALGARPDATARYQKTKWAAEEAVKKSGLQWTIFRPTLIFGPEDDFINKFEKMTRRLPFLVIIGDGKTKFQPIWVEDVARCYVQAIEDNDTIGEAYGLAGPEVYTFEDLMKILFKVTGRKRLILKMPLWLAVFNTKILEKILDPPPISMDQLIMLRDDNVCRQEMLCDMKKMLSTFKVEHRRVERTIKEYLTS